MHLLYGQDAVVAQKVSEIIGIKFEMFAAIGVVNERDELIGGVVYNNFYRDIHGQPLSIELSLGMLDKRWCTRNNVRALLAYPFIQLSVKRVQVTCREDDVFLRKLHERFGFTFEGIAREAHPLGGNSSVSSMLKQECFWIKNAL